MSFTSTTHETCLYIGSYAGQDILICRQVDDFMAAGELESPIRQLFQFLGNKINIEAEIGLVSHYNGIEIVQDREYIKIHVGKYIGKILANHGWEQGSKAESRLIDPLHPSAFKELEETAPLTSPAEKAELERSAGFAYRNAIGELLYAFVTCRLDIGYAMAELSKFSSAPAACHYAATKRVYRYLRQTQKEGMVYWRPRPREDLPHVPLVCCSVDEIDLKLPYPTEIDQLAAYVDAAHANCSKTHRSLGAEVFCLAGAAIYYRAKWIIVICTSSTQAEFVVCVRAGKSARYLRSILKQLGLPQRSATLIYVDNLAAIMMANAGKPTERSRHIDVQFFALLQWVKDGDVLLVHVEGTCNPSDALTKPLGWIIHHRHCYRVMGLAGSPYSDTSGQLG
jgi:hypothetical protein